MITRARNLGTFAQKGATPWNKGIDNRPTCIVCGEKRSYQSISKCRSCSLKKENHQMFGKKHTVESKQKMSETHKKNPSRYWLGKHFTEEHKQKILVNLKTTTGSENSNWKGDDVGYTALHDWVRRWLGTPSFCEQCKTTESKKFEWANISGEYKRDVTDWKRLCKKCHVAFDNTINRGWVTRKVANNYFKS